MSWNYRIVKHSHKKLVWYGLHEVYYLKNGKMDLWAPKPDAVGNDPKDLVAGLAIKLKDATDTEAPILDLKEMPGAKLNKLEGCCLSCGQKVTH